MADVVSTITVEDGPNRVVVHCANIYVDTGETVAIKVDKSTLLVNGAEPSKLAIEAIRWNVQGYTSVRIYADHATDSLLMAVAGSGQEDFCNGGPTDRAGTQGLVDPGSGSTGDIIFATAGATAGNTYDITLWVRKVP